MNTIVPGDHLVVMRTFGGIERGRVVVFQYPDDDAYFVARVVGLPGETILLRGQTVYINNHPLGEQKVLVKPEDDLEGEPLQEISTEGNGPYRVYYTQRTDEPEDPYVGANFGVLSEFHIPADSYFVVGDNRDNSADSRYRGAVPRDLIWGSPTVIYMSVPLRGGEMRNERFMKRIQ